MNKTIKQLFMQNKINFKVKKYFISLRFLCFALLCFLSINAVAQNEYAENRILVRFKEKCISQKNTPVFEIPEKIRKLCAKGSISEMYPLHPLLNKQSGYFACNTFVVVFNSPQDIMAMKSRLMETGLFEYVEPDYICTSDWKNNTKTIHPNDFYFPLQWALHNDGNFYNSVEDCDIDMTEAWGIERGDSTVIVGIIDSGIKYDHPEFAGRIWRNTKEIVSNSDDDYNGYVDDVFGWDFANSSGYPADVFGQGTFIAGIIAANGNNETGYAGVDWNCKIMNCKIFNDEGYFYYSWWIEAIYYCVDNGARVINFSYAISDHSFLVIDAVEYAYNNNVVIVSPIGSNGSDVHFFPAKYEHTIAVGSTDQDDYRTTSYLDYPGNASNYGSHLDVMAPGNFICGINFESDTSYDIIAAGTFISTAYVSGLVSLLIAQDKSRTYDEIENILHTTSEDRINASDPTGFDKYYGFGRINAYQALRTGSPSKDSVISQNQLKIFPNPAFEKFRFSMVINSNAFLTVSIYNNLGQFVGDIVSQEFEKGCYSFDVSTEKFQTGLYYLKFIAGSEVFIKKIIVLQSTSNN